MCLLVKEYFMKISIYTVALRYLKASSEMFIIFVMPEYVYEYPADRSPVNLYWLASMEKKHPENISWFSGDARTVWAYTSRQIRSQSNIWLEFVPQDNAMLLSHTAESQHRLAPETWWWKFSQTDSCRDIN